MNRLRRRVPQPRHRRPEPWRVKLDIRMEFLLRAWAGDLQRFLERAQVTVDAGRDPLPELAGDIRQLTAAMRTWADKVEDGAR